MVELNNRFFRAAFDPATGNLVQLLATDEPQSLVRAIFIQYRADGKLYSEIRDNPLAIAPEVISVRSSKGAVTSKLRTPHLQITRSFHMTPGSPLLRIRYEFVGTAAAKLNGPGLLFLRLAGDVNDVARDEKDLYFDGGELGRQRELPCWRVLYRKGHRRGVLVATRSKWQMSHLMYEPQAIEIRPHVRSQQQVNYDERDIPVDVTPGSKHVVELEIGPWWSGKHKALIRAAALDKPVRVAVNREAKAQALSQRVLPLPGAGVGQVLWAADVAPKSSMSDAFHPRKWLRLTLPSNPNRKALVCNAGVFPPSFIVKPKATGPCRVFVGASRTATLGLQFSGDPYPIYRMGATGTSFHSVLYGPHQMAELDFGVADLTGRTLRIVPNHNGHWPTRVDYVRVQPLTTAQAAAWKQRQASPLRHLLAGIPDCGDVFFYFMGRRDLDPRLVEGSIWGQVRAGFHRLYWQMHGSSTSFHTNIGTRTPMHCQAHGAFEPQSKAGVLFQRKHDLLRLAVETSRKLGIELWGASRMNSYLSGKRDAFFQKNLHMAEITEDGTVMQNKISYAFQEVRDYQRAILVEAAQYGLPGILLGFLRHPPMFLYQPILVSGYRQRYGKLPPRDMGVADPTHWHSMPESGPEYMQWYAYRAEFMTQFGRELKRDLRDKGLGHVKISLWLRPNHCLFDGINVEDWLKEGLCDEIIADIYPGDEGDLTEPRPQWRKMVQAKVPLLKGLGVAVFHNDYAAKNLPRFIKEGYDGFCSYESEVFAQTAKDLALLDYLRCAGSRYQCCGL